MLQLWQFTFFWYARRNDTDHIFQAIDILRYGHVNPVHSGFLAQLSHCAYTITFRKPYIASQKIWTIGLGTVRWLKIWTIGLRTVGPFDYDLIQIDDYPTDSCTISSSAFLLLPSGSSSDLNESVKQMAAARPDH